MHTEPPAELDALARQVLDAAFRVHRQLGPGLLESVYETCLAYELTTSGLHVQRQVIVPIRYRDVTLDAGLRIDLLVDDQLIVENKAVEKMIPLFEAQLLTYLRLTNRQLGLLINYNVPLLKDGIKHVINSME